MTKTWLILQSPADSAAWNMALDEALLCTAPDRDCPLLRVYSWRQPAVSIGYFQKFPAHLAEKYEIVRRPTGGGLVYHGDGVDTTYTVVVPQSDPLYKMNTAEAYCAIHQAVAAAVEFVVGRPESFRGGASVASISHVGGSRPTIEEKTRRYECFQNPVRGDVVDDGRKLAGGAQRRSKTGRLHQGSIAATVTADGLKRAFAEAFDANFHGYELSPAERALAEKLVREKYSTVAWNQR